MDYIDVPVLVRVDVSRVYLIGGPSFDLNIRAKIDQEEPSVDYDVKDETETFEMGNLAGVGFRIGKLLIEGRYVEGLTDHGRTNELHRRLRQQPVEVPRIRHDERPCARRVGVHNLAVVGPALGAWVPLVLRGLAPLLRAHAGQSYVELHNALGRLGLRAAGPGHHRGFEVVLPPLVHCFRLSPRACLILRSLLRRGGFLDGRGPAGLAGWTHDFLVSATVRLENLRVGRDLRLQVVQDPARARSRVTGTNNGGLFGGVT